MATRHVRAGIIIVFFMVMNASFAFTQDVRGEITAVEVNGNEVAVTYTLDGFPEADYLVDLYIVVGKGSADARKLSMVEGEVGKGKFAGSGRRIVWNMAELPALVEGAGYRFRISVDRPGIPWYYWVGGGVAVLGGGAAIILTKSGKDNGGGGGGGGTPTELPLPPPR